MQVYRIYVEKKKGFATAAASVLADLQTSLQLKGLTDVRLINRYDVQGISPEVFESVKHTIFSEPQVDMVYDTLPQLEENQKIFACEYLPGQFDQRADSCAQCIQLATKLERPLVKSATIYILCGKLTEEEFEQAVHYLINPVESRRASLEPVQNLQQQYEVPADVAVLNGFIEMDKNALAEFINQYGLAMDLDDIVFCQDYFKNTEKRDPTITEIRMIDTYWSDHCRHTTFGTHIDNMDIQSDYIQKAWDAYLDLRGELYAGKNKGLTLMDMATIAAKKLKKDGILKDLDESEEINACSVKIKVDVDGQEQDWLLMFKNETHNHPTEIEPFGGAATCLGGAIRDPLSGRSYVYQAMRVTGAANPLVPVKDTMPGKLPQKKITLGAAAGYSSYGNQIGLATGQVSEIYHSGYAAKRMEVGAVIAAAPEENVIRLCPQEGDIIILLGGKTGRDGCGGATGSSKSHTLESLESCGAEVQKGNAPEERKIQRLMRNGKATTLIKRCNDFGAGGVSVAIGELADGLKIDLDKVPKKYEGLDGTELAISESQERMAVVVAPENVEKFISLAKEENLDAVVVAVVTKEPRLKMSWRGKQIVDLSREFLNSNGAEKHTNIVISTPAAKLDTKLCKNLQGNYQQRFASLLADLNICSQKGLVERFDSTIGAGSVFMPYGGKYQMTPTQAMVAKIPVLDGKTTTASVMAYGFNPYLSEQSPYHGAVAAVVESIAKIVAAGGSRKQCWLTFQEYFERTQNNPQRWGKPAAALLGAMQAQLQLGVGAIGGKDSMSGTFENIDVPPTLISFAVSVTKSGKAISPEFKGAGHNLVLLTPKYDENGLPCFESVKEVFDTVEEAISSKKALSAWAVSGGGIAQAVAMMAMGNRIGCAFEDIDDETLFTPVYGSFVLELAEGATVPGRKIGCTTQEYVLCVGGEKIDMEQAQQTWEATLEPVFPVNATAGTEKAENFIFKAANIVKPKEHFAQPRVCIPVFPGTNCEYDTQKAFAGAQAEVFVVRNLSPADVEQSVNAFEKQIRQSQIIMIPGGFSGGDEPDGSGKFITSFFRNPQISDAVTELLEKRDGLMLGICNGFQALIKLGLVPYGKICAPKADSPTLTFNSIGRHQSKMIYTRICSNLSPWLQQCQVGDVHAVAISHGEGRFVASNEEIAALAKAGQIATQYVDFSGSASMDIAFNPNASACAIEGITSPDGRVFGKMGHSERSGEDIFKNIFGEKDQKIFASGIAYFK